METDLKNHLHPSLSLSLAHTPRGRHDLPNHVRWTSKPPTLHIRSPTPCLPPPILPIPSLHRPSPVFFCRPFSRQKKVQYRGAGVDVDVVEGRGRADTVFFCRVCSAFLLRMGRKNSGKKEGRLGGGGKKKKRRSVVKIETSADVDQGWGLGLDSYRPNQPSDEARRSVERLFIVFFAGYEKLHRSLLQGACLSLKVIK